jgi:predicted amidohydrolase/GNAT superfamily N-acetyltransferase
MQEAYSNWPGATWGEAYIEKLVTIFPKGQFVVVADDVVVGSALSIIVDYRKFGDDHNYQDITGKYSFDTHSPKGDVLYGIEVFIRPDYRGYRLGRRLYDARKELCEELNLRAIIFGGRIPNYHKYAEKLPPRQYLDKVKSKEIHDPTLSFQLSNDFHVKKLLTNYLPGDKESMDFATLLQWDNIYYKRHGSSTKPLYKPVVRLGLVQWQMRPYKTLEELFNQVEYFIDAVSGYKCDFALFPEFFNAPLMEEWNHLSEPQAIRNLASHTEAIRDRFAQLAISYNINIITGSMPLVRDGALLNVGYLCRRNGIWDIFEKIHITPTEVKFWGMTGGRGIRVFDTDCGKVGICICYDVEFPEIARIMATEGMKILFVPFLTDTQNGYSRVRNCAQARAIENECYVAIAGSVGNLPKVHNMDIQFAQSMVFTPCDFAFPVNGIKAEATPNTEMILVVDVDLDLLTELHESGSVRNLKDRRTDHYEIVLKP